MSDVSQLERNRKRRAIKIQCGFAIISFAMSIVFFSDIFRLAMLIGIALAWVLSLLVVIINHVRNPYATASLIVSFIGLMMAVDMYDEMTYSYGATLADGNGFLLSGIGTLVYVYAIPATFFISIVLTGLRFRNIARQ